MWILRLSLEEKFQFEPSAAVEAGMAFAFVTAEGGVFAVDVSVAGTELFEESAFLDTATADIVGKTCK